MDAKYKIVFRGEFKEWVEQEDFIEAISRHLKVGREKAAALLEVDRKITLKKNLTELEADRHAAAFEKMGMLVTKKLMMKPFVGPRIERVSHNNKMGNARKLLKDEVGPDVDGDPAAQQTKSGLSSLASGIKSLVNKGGS